LEEEEDEQEMSEEEREDSQEKEESIREPMYIYHMRQMALKRKQGN